MVVHDDDIGLGRAAPRLEQEAAVEVGTLESRAQVRLRGHRVPHVGGRLLGQIRETAVRGARGPCREGFDFRPAPVVEQRVLPRARLIQSRQAQVVPPPLEQREGDGPVSRRERPGEDRQILADELLLQVDRVRGDNGALAVGARPLERGHEVGERLAHARPRLEQRDAAVVVDVRRVGRHIALAGAILEGRAAQRAGDGACLREEIRDGDRVEARHAARPRALDHHIEGRHGIVDDAEPHATVVQARRDGEVGAGGIEHAAGVIVQQHIAALGDAGEGEHGVHRAARHDARLGDHPVRVGADDERHLAAVRGRDLCSKQLPHRRGEALRAHVLSSRFLAAGNSTLLRMSR